MKKSIFILLGLFSYQFVVLGMKGKEKPIFSGSPRNFKASQESDEFFLGPVPGSVRNSPSELSLTNIRSDTPEKKSSELQVEGIVKAVLEVKFGEGSKTIKLIEDDGKTVTNDEDRQFDFSVDTNCANPKIKLEPVKQFGFEDGKGWSLTDSTGKYKLMVNITLQHNNGKEFEDIAWDQSGSSYSIKKEDRRKNTEWRLFFDPYLDKAQEPGIYAGAVKVVIISE